jgi:hypothetical protein
MFRKSFEKYNSRLVEAMIIIINSGKNQYDKRNDIEIYDNAYEIDIDITFKEL